MSRPKRRPRDVGDQLDAVYAQLPAIACKGRCQESCGPIRMTAPELRRIAARGVDIPVRGLPADVSCPALTVLGRCAVYEVRPAICRLWGLVESMPCPYGCVPEGGHLPDARGHALLADVYDIAGDHVSAARKRETAANEGPRRTR